MLDEEDSDRNQEETKLLNTAQNDLEPIRLDSSSRRASPEPQGGNSNAQQSQQQQRQQVEEEEDELTPDEQAEVVLNILYPVSLTMLLVVIVVKSITLPLHNQAFGLAMAYAEKEEDSTGTKLGGALLNAFLFVCLIVTTTVIFVLLYKYRCTKVIIGWLMGSTGMLLAVFGGLLMYLVFDANQLPVDWITFSVILWNFVAVGLIAIFYYSPQKMNQGYLIVVSALMAIFFTQLPEWTTWAILAAIAVYDIFAVLCPSGPLKVLVETAQERQEPIPALLYNGFVFITMANQESDIQNSSHNREDAERPAERFSSNDADRKSVKLGLGDFVFYSVLIGRAAMYDMASLLSCFMAIIAGLFSTLVLLGVFRKALPALPISIFLGIICFLLSKLFVVGFVNAYGVQGVFV